MMSIFEVPREGKHQRPAGIFEPSTELLEKYRSILASSPPAQLPTSKRNSFSESFSLSSPTNLPFQPEQRRLSSRYISFAPPPPAIERKQVHKVKDKLVKAQIPVAKRSRSPSLPYLIHPNIVDHLDILQDSTGEYAITFTTMTTLEALLSFRLGVDEADCYFKQAARGVSYLHNSGVAHQNLRPENLVITIGGVLKIANFDAAETFTPFRNNKDRTHQAVSVTSRQRWSNADYIAPEVFVESCFDPRPVDMWALGVLYMEMRMGRLLWSFAAEGADENYDRYLVERNGLWGYRPIENIRDEHCRRVVGSLLDPVPEMRYTAAQVVRSTWCRGIELSSFVKNETQ